MKKIFILVLCLTVISLILFSPKSFAQNGRPCPDGLVSGMTINEEFGSGSQEITDCISKRKNVKVVYQINQLCRDTACTKPYAIGNINNAINDYEITHGMERGKDYEIVAIVHSGGGLLVINNNAETPYPESNPFQAYMEDLISKGVKVFFCQNTARTKGIVTANMIPGIKYVPSGLTAIADYQSRGYSYVQP